MRIAVLIQANGNNIRLGKYFKQPKYELYYKGNKIIELIKKNSLDVTNDVFIALRENSNINFNPNGAKIVYCNHTNSRLDTLKQCKDIFNEYDSVIIHDCDVIIESTVLSSLYGNSFAISTYKYDGMMYGFVELDSKFRFVNSNEKEKETPYISIGAYCVDSKDFLKYLETGTEESLLQYYNQCKNVEVSYSENFINIGDIKSYMKNLWSL